VLRPALATATAVGLVVALVVAGLTLRAAPADDFGAADRDALLAWADDQLPAGTTMAADGLLGQDLLRAGVDVGPGGLQVTRGAAPDGAAVVARFGDADTGLVVVDPQHRAPDADERALRRQLAGALLTNPTTADAGQVTGALLSGDVDPRLLTLLAGIAAQYGVGVSDLPVVPGEVGPARRFAVVDSVGGTRLVDDPDLTELVRGWLSAQLPPYSPSTVETVDGGLRVGFDYASAPDDLVSASAG
jgi:hypothetical protein